jgi:hypothetical protein
VNSGQDDNFERRVFERRVLVAYKAVLAGLEAAEARFPRDRGEALRSLYEQDADGAIVSLYLYHEEHYGRDMANLIMTEVRLRLVARGDVVRPAQPSPPLPRPPRVEDPTVLSAHELQDEDSVAVIPMERRPAPRRRAPSMAG